MTIAPSHTTMKNFHPRCRPLSQPLSITVIVCIANRLILTSTTRLALCFFFVQGMFPFLCLSFHSVRHRKLCQKCVAACITGTVAYCSGRVGTFYNPLELSLSPPAFFVFVFEKGMFALLKTCVNGARCRLPEGSL